MSHFRYVSPHLRIFKIYVKHEIVRPYDFKITNLAKGTNMLNISVIQLPYQSIHRTALPPLSKPGVGFACDHHAEAGY